MPRISGSFIYAICAIVPVVCQFVIIENVDPAKISTNGRPIW